MTSRKWVYVASAYRIGDQALNVRRSLLLASRLESDGYHAVAPLLSHFWHMVTPQDERYWLDYDIEMLSRCDALLWDKSWTPGESKGAMGEWQWAASHGVDAYTSREALLREMPPVSVEDEFPEDGKYGLGCS